MNYLRNTICGAIVLASAFLPLSGQTYPDHSATTYEGLYPPAGELGSGWSCSPEFVGIDGGAVAIEGGI